MSRRLRIVSAVGATAICLAAAGCVSIPDSSGVGSAREVGVTDQTAQITNVVQGPLDGASPQSIVFGFFAAMLAYPRTFDVAREFLTPDAAASWDPDKTVTVYDRSPQVSGEGPRVTVTADTSGWLDARGTWTSSVPGHAERQMTLRLQKVDGEWRISRLPDGTSVDTDFFNRYYKAFSLYFFDPSRSILTPDPVYIPLGDTEATTLVSDLLDGPTGDLQRAVVSAAPADAQLEVSVSVSSSGLAEVPLSANVMKLPGAERQLFAAQLAWTLRQVDGVQRIAISVDGTNLPIENAGSSFDATGFAAFDPAGLAGERRLFALDRDGLVTVSSGSASRVLGPIGQVRGGTSVAVQTSGQLAAVVTDDGHAVSVGPISNTATDAQGVVTWYQDATSLLRPSWDARQTLWLVDRTASGPRVLVVTGPHHAYPVSAPWLNGEHVAAFSVSRDGVRLAAIVIDPNGRRHLVVSTIDRGPVGPSKDPVSLRKPIVVTNTSVPLTRIRDLAWVSPTSLAVLASEPHHDLQPYEVAIDGSDIEAAGGFLPVTGTSIAAGPNTDAPIAIATSDGAVYVQAPDLLWTLVDATSALYAPTYPG